MLFCFFFNINRFHYKWDHTAFVPVWLSSLSMIPLRSICVVANGRISFFFMAKLYLCVCVCVWEREWVCMCHIFFIHLSTDTYVVPVSWLLWMMLLWTWGFGYCFDIVSLFPSIKGLEVELLGHVIVLFVISWTSTLFHRCCTNLHSHSRLKEPPVTSDCIFARSAPWHLLPFIIVWINSWKPSRK